MSGWGWFVERTPADDCEFTTPGNQGEQRRMDLLSVVMHEIGHILGQDHEADGLMAETQTAGARRALSPDGDADMSRFAADALFALLTADEEPAWIGSSTCRRGRTMS